MSVEFRMGHQDHHKVEDFLASNSSGGVGAIALHSSAAKHQLAASEAARAAGLDVLYDPRTERLAYPGYGLEKIPGYTGAPYPLDVLARSPEAREKLVDAVVTAHPDLTTIVTPPAFFAGDEASVLLNLALAEATRLATDKDVRPVLTLGSRVGAGLVRQAAEEYANAGFTQIEIRISPLGGENDGVPKIKKAFRMLDQFTDAGLNVTLGQSGNIGQAAVALGHAEHYSVGIGQLESVNHASIVQRQSKPPILDDEGKKKGGGGWEGVYLPGIALTVSKKVGADLLGHTGIRTRIGCRIGSCASSIVGPLSDHRTHYLHSRAAEMEKILAQPRAWRSKGEIDRLVRAVELRKMINDKYRTPGTPELKTRTLTSIIGEIESDQATAVA